MQDLYRALVSAQAHRFAQLFEHLLQAQAPLVFHCTAGKDRTGLAAAWILLALGVPRTLVMQDYLLTNQLLRPAIASLHTHSQAQAQEQSQAQANPGSFPAEASAVLWGVQASFLETALHLVDTEHGGIDHYLRHHLRLTPAALRALQAKYLQDL